MAEKTDMNKSISKVLVSEEQLRARVAEMGAQLSEDYEGKNVILVCILKGAVHFFSDLSRAMTCHMEMDFMSISSYGNGRKTSGIVRIAKDMDTDITGRHVLIVEDIMDSGLTLSYLTKILWERKPASLKIACLLDKPSRRMRHHTGLLRLRHPQRVRVGLRPRLRRLLPQPALCGCV